MLKKTITTHKPVAWPRWSQFDNDFRLRLIVFSAVLLLCFATPGLAAGSNPWEDGVTNLRDLFTGTVARALSIVAIIVGGLMFAFGEGGSKKMLSGIVFGVGMAIGAANFMDWLFPGAK